MSTAAMSACTPSPETEPATADTHTLPIPLTTPPYNSPTGPSELLDATCAVDLTNALRAWCTVSLTAPGHVEIELTDGEETVLFATDTARATVDLPIWGLHADSAWSFTVVGEDSAVVEGVLQPGALPEEMSFDPGLTGTGPTEIVQAMVPLDCTGGGWNTVIDHRGRPRWYAPSGGRLLDMVQFTDAFTVLSVFDKDAVGEVDLMGRETFMRRDLDLPVHHDAFRRNDQVYVLAADEYPGSDGNSYVEDVVIVLDPAGEELRRLEIHDLLDATQSESEGSFWAANFPGAIDAWHTNGVFVTEDNDLVLSVRFGDALIRVSGADGSIEWVLASGGSVGGVPSDFTLSGSPDALFDGQHHPAILPNGDVTVFDNAGGRGLQLHLDEAAGTFSFVAEWRTHLNCAYQGSIFPLANGHVLVACATPSEVFEFDAAGVEVGHFDLACPNGETVPDTWRAQPMDLWDGVTVDGVTATRVP